MKDLPPLPKASRYLAVTDDTYRTLEAAQKACDYHNIRERQFQMDKPKYYDPDWKPLTPEPLFTEEQMLEYARAVQKNAWELGQQYAFPKQVAPPRYKHHDNGKVTMLNPEDMPDYEQFDWREKFEELAKARGYSLTRDDGIDGLAYSNQLTHSAWVWWRIARAAIASQQAEPVYRARSPLGEPWREVSQADYKKASKNGFEVEILYRAEPPKPVDSSK